MSLNTEQKDAVDHVEGPMLVLAGAGAGKTRVVTQRIAHLLELGVPASSILAVTFTNKAAGEMQERVRRTCNKHVLISTFHSLGARILRESISHLGYANDFAIYDEDDTGRLLRACLQELGIKKYKPKVFRSKISEAKNNLTVPEGGHTEVERMLPDIYALYQARLKESNALDFDDLLFLTVKLFQECPDVLTRYQRQWRFLLIDEYQDTNKSQYLIAKMLVAHTQNIFVVGDPDQSIYSWRGANIENILNFEEDYPGARTIRLEQNYRSTNTILEAANAVIQHNGGRLEKNLWSDLGQGEPIMTARCGADRDEADFVVEQIDSFHCHEQIPLSDMVIFYRTNAQSRPLEDALLARRIPYVIVGGISFYQRREVKDILALLRVIDSGADFLSFARTVNLPKRGLGDTTMEKLRLGAQGAEMRIFDFCAGGAEGIRLSAKQRDGLADYVQIIRHLRSLKGGELFELVHEAIETSGYLNVLKEDPETFDDRKANLDELVTKAAEHSSLTDFLEELALKSSLDEASNENERLCLMTIHNGKGLEFRVTFMVGMEEGLFPHQNSLGNQEKLEEERRLCYVGMTRAKERLIMTSAAFRFLWGQSQTMRPSRFFKEIPGRYTTELDPYEEVSHVPEYEEQEDLLEGEAVYHSDFGPGEIETIGENDLGLVYRIRFARDGRIRTLVAKYAKLSRYTA